MENNCLNSVLARVTYKNANHCGQLAQFIGLISKKGLSRKLLLCLYTFYAFYHKITSRYWRWPLATCSYVICEINRAQVII